MRLALLRPQSATHPFSSTTLTSTTADLAEKLDARQYEGVDLGSDDFRCALRREPLGVVVSVGGGRMGDKSGRLSVTALRAGMHYSCIILLVIDAQVMGCCCSRGS